MQELRTLAHPDAIRHDAREARCVLHALQIAMQAAPDIASHIVSGQRWESPRRTASCSSAWLEADG